MDAAGFFKVLPFAKHIGVDDSTVRNYLAGKAASAGGVILSKLAQGLGVTERWLSTGEGSMRPGDEPLEFIQQMGRIARLDGLPAAHRLALESVEDLIQEMNEEQLLEFHRGLRDLARKVKKKS